MTEPQQGDFFVTEIKGFTGLFVRLAQRLTGSKKASHWTHAGIYVGDGVVLEAEPGGAVLTHLEDYEGRKMLWSSELFELNSDTRMDLAGEANALLDVPYSFVDYLSIALHRAHIRPKWVERYVQATGHMICSQLVDEVYKRCGIHLFDDGRLPQDVVPADLGKLLEDRLKEDLLLEESL